MATFNRIDICHAHRALENDWNEGGWLRERPSNRRRREASHVQLDRIGFKPELDSGCSFETLTNANQRRIYCEALQSFGMVRYLSRRDESHAGIIRFARRHGFAWVQTDFTQLPLAAKGLQSYRYRGRYGFVMIGARDDGDALREAARSVEDHTPTLDRLEYWTGAAYAPVSERIGQQ